MRIRKEILIDLVQNKREVSSLKKELSYYPWDCEKPLYTVDWDDISGVLDQYLLGITDSSSLENWANAIESREDLDFENEEVQQIIIEIANPILFGLITREKIENYRKKLRTQRSIMESVRKPTQSEQGFNMDKSLTNLEKAILEKIASAPQNRHLFIEKHLPFLVVKSRNLTGVGMYVYFDDSSPSEVLSESLNEQEVFSSNHYYRN